MMKTYTIELQRIHAASNQHGLVQMRIDATVLPAPRTGDDATPSTVLNISIENARVLLLQLKAQLAEVDGRKARSQR